MGKIEWTEELVNILIEEYETKPCLYDSRNRFYSNEHARNDSLLQIKCTLKNKGVQVEVEDVKKKIVNVRQQFSHENANIQASQRSGMGSFDIHEPVVWLYDKLLILNPYVKSRKSKSCFDELSQLKEADSDNIVAGVIPTIVSPKKRKLTETDPVLKEAVETLQQLQVSMKNPTHATKSECEFFGDYVGSELQGIDDPEIVIELKQEISKSIYEAKKKWIKTKKQNQENNIFLKFLMKLIKFIKNYFVYFYYTSNIKN